MGKKNPKQPAAPNPVVTADAQTKSNKETAITQAYLNNVNQVGPYGSVTYKQIGSKNGVPQFQQTTTLSDAQKGIAGKQQHLESATLGLGQDQIGRISAALSQPLNFDNAPAAVTNVQAGDLTPYEDIVGARNKQEEALFERANRTLAPMQEQQQRAFDTRLANQGIELGSEAYKTAYDNFTRGQNDERDLARNSSIVGGRDELASLFGMDMARQAQQFGQGVTNAGLANTGRANSIQETLTKRNQPINELAALLGTSGGVTMPQFQQTNQTGVAGTDIAGINGLSYQQQLAAANAKAQAGQGTMGSLYGLAGSLGSAAILASDIRLKHDIEPAGMINGVPLYDFKYNDQPEKTYRGCMAQDVLFIKPDAVMIDAETGFMSVNYEMLGFNMEQVNG